MSTELPIELIELIVDEVSRSNGRAKSLTALSLVCKAFTSSCQQRLWYYVTLHSVGKTSQKQRGKTLTLARRIPSCPHLGAFVTRLSYRVHSQSDSNILIVEDLEVVAQALQCMTSILDFSLTYGSKRSVTALDITVFPEVWRNTIFAIGTGHRLQELSLCRITNIPADIVKRALGRLTSLKVFKCSLSSLSPGIADMCCAEDTTQYDGFSSLETLECDMRSYYGLSTLSQFDSESSSLRSVKFLDLMVDDHLEGDHGILSRATCLETLHILCLRSADSGRHPISTLLGSLNSASYHTLTRLRVIFHHATFLPPTSEPFTTNCVDTLARLTSLRTFEVDIYFTVPSGHHNSIEWEQLKRALCDLPWDRLDTTLCSLVELGTVRLRIYLKYYAGWNGHLTMVNHQNAEQLEDYIWDDVYSTQLEGLRTRHHEGSLNFDFLVNVHSS